MSFPKLTGKLFKRETSQPSLPPITLDQSEWRMLKELATYFLSVDFPGSQLEALLLARASQPVSNIDETTASILTPSPAVLTTPSASGSEVEADAQTIQPPLVPSPADRTATRTPSPQSAHEPKRTESHPTSPIVVDSSFECCIIDGTDSSTPVEVDNFSYCTDSASLVQTSAAFANAIIKDATVANHSFNGNNDCFNSRVNGPHVVNKYSNYRW